MTRRYGSGMHMYTPTSGDDPDYNYLSETNFNGLSYANGDYLSRNIIRTDNYQINFTLNYARDFGHHHVGALFSIEKSEAESEFVTGQVNNPLPYTNHQSNSGQGDKTTEFNRAESGTLSYIGRINYAYMDRYLFEFLLRSDASTKFAPENYWGTFPAISGGWVISEEPWFQNTKWLKFVDFLKIRASWGLTGRDNLAAWQWLQVYTLDAKGNPIFGEGTNIDPSKSKLNGINKNTSAINRDAHWDKSYKTNIGLDFQFLNKRLAVNFDYYFEKNREMLMNIAQDVPSTVGTQSASVNLGEMNNWGWELGITWRDKIGKDFKYRVGINTGYSDNEVLNMDFATDYIYRQIQRGGRTDIGTWGMQCIGMFRSFQDIEEYFQKYNITSYMGMTKDKVRPGMLIYKDVRGAYNQETGEYDGPDGIVDQANDQVCLSNRSNPYGFTVNLHADWKGLSLTAQLGASWGGYTTLPAAAIGVASGANIEYYNMPSFWNPDNMYTYQDVYDGSGNLIVKQNRDAQYPNLAYQSVNAVASNFWRISAASVRLSRITLAYQLPKEWFKSVGIKNVRINITGQNLINFYNPYPDKFTSPMAGTYGAYPTLRKWDIGLNLSF
jgi:TonB-linked SusC/RagA family outer membrane protein